MEKNKLYLSVSKVQRSALPLGIRIKLHDEMIYWVYIKYRDMEPSLFLNVNNINYLENVHLLAQEIEDFIICDVYNDKEISNDDMFMIPVIALRIAEQYVYGGENAIMWDITDMEDTYQVFPEDEVENEYDKRTNKLYQSAINNLKEMDRKYMEKKKLYLSITMDSNANDYIITLHPNNCYTQFIAKDSVKVIIARLDEDYKNLKLLQFDNMVSTIYDIIWKNKNYLERTIIWQPSVLNTAFKIALDYFKSDDFSAMWDITDIDNPEKVEDTCEYCDECDDEEPEDEEKNYIAPMLDRIDDLQDQIHDLENKLDDDILTTGSKISLLNKSIDKLENEAFPNDELTARAQIRMTNKRIDQLEQQMGSISNRLIYLNQFVKQYIND